MKTLYLDCAMGAAGDMLTAALLELLPDPDGSLKELNAIGIPGVAYAAIKTEKCGITGTRIAVTVDGAEEGTHDHHHDHEHDHPHEHEQHDHDHGHAHHAHSSMDDIRHLVCGHLKVGADVAKDVMAVYELIAEAESHVHGRSVSQIHFHEVGTMDAVADITAFCMLMKKIGPDEVVVSPVHVGSGQVHCAHGILPVPAPATAYILQGIPSYGGEIQGELCTPTGAALLKHFATRFGAMPVMKTEAIGYSCGKKDFPAANCVRAMLGTTDDAADRIVELSCNVDDMTGEEIGFATERLFEGGAREVFTVPVGMKRSRPGTLLCVLCDEKDREEMLKLIFTHTTTIGVRESIVRRYVLDRRIETLRTSAGDVRCKVSSGYGVRREKLEYRDLERIAKENGTGLRQAKETVLDESKDKKK